MVAGTHSGVGKTTVATALMAALRRAGERPVPAKAGPDFIDPGFHALATGQPGRNLDLWISGEQGVLALAGRAAAAGRILLVEGVMGLFDGAGWEPQAGPAAPFGSTAHLAGVLEAPVVLVVDASGLSHSAAALLAGYRDYPGGAWLKGVIFNRVGGAGHRELLMEAAGSVGVSVMGMLGKDESLRRPSRHLGLVPASEDRAEAISAIEAAAAAVEAGCDLGALVRLANSAPAKVVPDLAPVAKGPGAPVAVASGKSFGFTYPDNLEALAAAGAELMPFDPGADESLPAGAKGLYIGGGFPELAALELAANTSLLAQVRQAHAQGLPIWAECGGMLWLTKSLDGARMAGIIPAEATMSDRLTLGYRRVQAVADSPIAFRGGTLRGHEFHYSRLNWDNNSKDGPSPAWRAQGRRGASLEGYASGRLIATYVHAHLGSDPTPAERFVASCASPSTPTRDVAAG